MNLVAITTIFPVPRSILHPYPTTALLCHSQDPIVTQFSQGCPLFSHITHYSHSIGWQQLLGRHGGEVRNVGERVHKGHQWNGDVDGTRQIPDRGHAQMKPKIQQTHMKVDQRQLKLKKGIFKHSCWAVSVHSTETGWQTLWNMNIHRLGSTTSSVT